jgi:hypothetical protein
MQDKTLRHVDKCVHCGRAKNMHRAYTLDCPNGKRTPIGYSSFGPQQFTPAAGHDTAGDDASPAEPADTPND